MDGSKRPDAQEGSLDYGSDTLVEDAMEGVPEVELTVVPVVRYVHFVLLIQAALEAFDDNYLAHSGAIF